MTDILERLTASLADRYRIERELGAGGMATVYLAYDVRHDRRVALKVLRPELSAILGGARFLTEIKTTANLQHPHILGLFDSGEADGTVFYVMPYVDGESLRDRLSREKQLPVDEAVRIAREVADALHYAHQHGIVHRDIKPENILLHGGHAMVADFGIALAASRSDGGSRMTETGMSLGTPHYMAPEQAMGEREITPKADIYALGCVLYEMLTAEPPFTGATAQAIIARVMTESPRNLTLQRHTIPAGLDAVVRRALEKLPADRFASAADFSAALANPTATLATTTASTERRSRAPRTSHLVPWLLFLIAAGAFAWQRWKPVPLAPTLRFSLGLPDSLSVRTEGNNRDVAFAPDGSRFVYTGTSVSRRRMLYERALDQLEPRLIPGTENAEGPFFSPDGEWVAFFADGKLRKVALAGGPPLTVADASGGRGGTWNEAGTIVFAPNAASGLLRVSAAGGPVDTVTKLTGDSGSASSHRMPFFLPGGRALVFTALMGASQRVYGLDLESRTETRLADGGMDGRYAPTGHLVYGTEAGALVAVPFDPEAMRVTGSPVSLLEGMLVKQAAGVADFTFSSNGRLLYLAGSQAPRTLVLVDNNGLERPLGEMLALGSPRFAPDGRRLAISSVEGRTPDIRVLDVERRTLSRLTFEGTNTNPEWTPDGRRVAFATTRPGSQGVDLWWAPADGSGEARRLIGGPGPQLEVQLTRDGRTMVFRQSGQGTRRDLWIASVDSPQNPRPYLTTPFEERAQALSPDGRWLAYTSDESGRDEIYVRAFPQPEGRWQVSANGGIEPRWARHGRALYYRSGDSLISVSVTSAPTFIVGQRSLVFTRPYFSGDTHHAQWDVAPGDRGFVFIRSADGRTASILALDWFAELRRRRGGAAAPVRP